MSGSSNFKPKSAILQWTERRLPILGLMHSSFVAYPTPRNLNYWWTFGGILSFCLGVQIITGIVLAMHYVANTSMAFDSHLAQYSHPSSPGHGWRQGCANSPQMCDGLAPPHSE